MNQQERRKALVSEAIASNPNIQQARKLILVLSVVLISFRALHVLLEILVGETQVVVQNTITTVVLCLFLLVIHQGVRLIAILPLIGSVTSLMNFFGGGIVPGIFLTGDMLITAYVLVFITSQVMQGAIMIVFLANSKCREYFKVIEGINTQLKSEFSRKKL